MCCLSKYCIVKMKKIKFTNVRNRDDGMYKIKKVSTAVLTFLIFDK